jgi:hypothetical protein
MVNEGYLGKLRTLKAAHGRGGGGYNRLGIGDSRWASHSTKIRTVVENLDDACLERDAEEA